VHTVGVCGVTYGPRGQVLLVRTARAGWELPGGRVEAGEDLVQALVRETREEAGCEIDVGRLVGVYLVVSEALLLLVFHATSTTVSPARQADEDALEAAWFAPDEALRLVTHAGEHQRLADALADQPGVMYRAVTTGSG